MVTQNLYQPNTERTAGAVEKTAILTRRVLQLEADVALEADAIRQIELQHAPDVVAATEGENVARLKYEEAMKKRRVFEEVISHIDGEVARLEESVRFLRTERVLHLASLSARAGEEATAREHLLATKSALRAEVEKSEVESRDKVQHVASLKRDLDKAKYRLSQHLARHPAATLDAPVAPSEG